jgi:hypothetical protein
MKSSGSSIPQPRSRLSETHAGELSRPGVRVVGLSRSPSSSPCLNTGPVRFHPWPTCLEREARGAVILTLAPSPETLSGSHSPFEVFIGDGPSATLHVDLTRSNPASSGRLSWGCPRIAPPSTQPARVHSRSDSGEGAPDTRPRPAMAWTRSALAVPPGFDGLLRASTRRLVASCSRPWGSPRFGSGSGMSRRCFASSPVMSPSPRSPRRSGWTGCPPWLASHGRPARAGGSRGPSCGSPRNRSPTLRPSSPRTSNSRRRAFGLRSRVAAVPAFEGSSGLGPRCRGPCRGTRTLERRCR